MPASNKPALTEATCPKCGETVQRAGQKFLVLGVWQCSKGHPFTPKR